MQSEYRKVLSTNQRVEELDRGSVKAKARDEMMRSLQEKERELAQAVKTKDQKIDELFK